MNQKHALTTIKIGPVHIAGDVGLIGNGSSIGDSLYPRGAMHPTILLHYYLRGGSTVRVAPRLHVDIMNPPVLLMGIHGNSR